MIYDSNEVEERRTLSSSRSFYECIKDRGIPPGYAIVRSHNGKIYTPQQFHAGVPNKQARGFFDFIKPDKSIVEFLTFEEALSFLLSQQSS